MAAKYSRHNQDCQYVNVIPTRPYIYQMDLNFSKEKEFCRSPKTSQTALFPLSWHSPFFNHNALLLIIQIISLDFVFKGKFLNKDFT